MNPAIATHDPFVGNVFPFHQRVPKCPSGISTGKEFPSTRVLSLSFLFSRCFFIFPFRCAILSIPETIAEDTREQKVT